MTISPSHPPLSSSLSRFYRPPPPYWGRYITKYNKKEIVALAMNMNPVPFVPTKVLDISKHEQGLRKLGLWDFAHLEFDSKVRNDLIANLIINYNYNFRASYVDESRIMVNQTDMARALNLPCKRPAACGKINWPRDFILFLHDFVSSWMLLHEDTWVLPSEVMNWIEMIKEGHPEKVYWANLIWFMVKRELSKGSHLVNCYYASHLQHLIKCQKEVLFKEKSPDKAQEIVVLDKAVDRVENLEMAAPDHLENLGSTGDAVKTLKLAVTVKAMEDMSTEADIVIPDDDGAEEGEDNPRDVSSKQTTYQVDDDDDHEDDEPVEELDKHHGGPSSPIFGNSSKRARDLDHDIPTQKKTRTDNLPKPAELDFSFDQIYQWIDKCKVTYMTTQQTTMSQQQILESKDRLIQQLKMNNDQLKMDCDQVKMENDQVKMDNEQLKMQNDELQRRSQAETAQLEKKLCSMNNIIDSYRNALKRSHESCAEYKKLFMPAEPLYEDAGEGGLVKTVEDQD